MSDSMIIEQDRQRMEAPPAYQALALQCACDAVNTLSVEESRQQILDSIDRIGKLIGGSRGFLASFNGSPPRLVVLPEYFLTSFPLGESIEAWQAKACLSMDGPEYERLGRLASSLDIYLSGNVYELDPHFPRLYFQTSFVIAPSGDVIVRYRRLISMYAPTPHDVLDDYLDIYGHEGLFPVADTDIGRLACVASEEILYPELTRAHALRGAEVLCHSSSEVGSPRPTPKNIAKQARAYENMMYVVSANSASVRGIPFPEASTEGHSQVVDFKGMVLGEASPGESMCGNGIVDIPALREARRKPAMTNTLARQRLEIFARTYGERQVYPANSLAGVEEPRREHFRATLERTIEALDARGLI